MDRPDWIAVDWGTTHLRAFAMRGDVALAAAASADGMASLSPADFETALLGLIEPWLDAGTMPVIACGMVGARQGWVEAPYRAVPCAPVAPGETLTVPTRDRRIRVEIVPGLAQADPADVMRGEETQIAGFLRDRPEFHGVLLLPGTHSKHVSIEGGQVTAFATHMTGELFAVLTRQTVLRHSVSDEGHDDIAFLSGAQDGLRGGALAHLFGLRAGGLVHGISPVAARSRLSGLLIGAEIAALPRADRYVAIGNGILTGLYARALTAAGLEAVIQDGEALVRKGLGIVREGAGT